MVFFFLVTFSSTIFGMSDENRKQYELLLSDYIKSYTVVQTMPHNSGETYWLHWSEKHGRLFAGAASGRLWFQPREDVYIWDVDTTYEGLENVACDPDSDTLYHTASKPSAAMYAWNIQNDETKQVFEIEEYWPETIACNATHDTLYVGEKNSIKKYSTKTGKVEHYMMPYEVAAMCCNKKDNVMHVALGNEHIQVRDCDNLEVCLAELHTKTDLNFQLMLDSSANMLYVNQQNKILRCDVSNRIIKPIEYTFDEQCLKLPYTAYACDSSSKVLCASRAVEPEIKVYLAYSHNPALQVEISCNADHRITAMTCDPKRNIFYLAQCSKIFVVQPKEPFSAVLREFCPSAFFIFKTLWYTDFVKS